jgi:hypothetical protein
MQVGGGSPIKATPVAASAPTSATAAAAVAGAPIVSPAGSAVVSPAPSITPTEALAALPPPETGTNCYVRCYALPTGFPTGILIVIGTPRKEAEAAWRARKRARMQPIFYLPCVYIHRYLMSRGRGCISCV